MDLSSTPEPSRTPGSARKRASSFKLELPGDDAVSTSIREKIKIVKDIFRGRKERVNYSDIISRALDALIHSEGSESTTRATLPPQNPDDSDPKYFITTGTSIRNLLDIVYRHDEQCKERMNCCDRAYMVGTAACYSFQCARGHIISWTSSPFLPNGTFLVNARWMHATISTGLLPNQIERLQDGMGFYGHQLPEEKDLFSRYAEVVRLEKNISCDNALLEEIGSSLEEDGAISILTDARHGCRRNSKDTNVVCIGSSSHKVIREEHVTKTDDQCSQRHELIGTKRLYQYFDSDIPSIGGPVRVHIHAHDRNASVNKYIREERPDTVNQNDTWHAAKSVQKAISAVGKGPKKQHGKTWHEEIADKINSVRVHVQHAIRNCNNDTQILREKLDNVVAHYKNSHGNCSDESRCKQDPNYEPSKLLIRNPKAEDLLRTAIQNTVVYKSPADFVHAMDTFYVESFNNVLNIFLDKRIHFGEKAYNMRTSLAICHWNENVDRQATSIYHANSGQKKKNLSQRTFDYRHKIWQRFLKELQ